MSTLSSYNPLDGLQSLGPSTSVRSVGKACILNELPRSIILSLSKDFRFPPSIVTLHLCRFCFLIFEAREYRTVLYEPCSLKSSIFYLYMWHFSFLSDRERNNVSMILLLASSHEEYISGPFTFWGSFIRFVLMVIFKSVTEHLAFSRWVYEWKFAFENV